MKLLVSLAAAASLLAPSSPAQDRTPGYLTFERLKSEIGTSLRWLRDQQEVETGAYGKSVLVTAKALIAFADSPWAYGYEDGPFVSGAVDHLVARQDPASGLIHDPGLDRARGFDQTAEAMAALAFFPDAPGVAAALEKGRAFVRKDVPSWEETFADLSDAAILASCEDMLAGRKDGGFWTSPMGDARATAIQVGRLNGCYAALAARRTPKPEEAKAAVALPPFAPADRAKAAAALERGAAYLIASAGDGLWGFDGRPDPGITAMVVGALLATPAPRGADVDAAVARALDWLVSLQHEDGSIHAGQVANYVTSASVLALVRAGREKDRAVIAKARAYLQGLQADEGEGYEPSDKYYGGIGYGSSERPDLSNLQMALDALNAAGVEPGDPTMQKALAFLQRCQNRSESNDLVVTEGEATIRAGEDGGGTYGPGDSKAGLVTLADGTRIPRSYGSMTYALLKGYLFAGLPKDDPRVQAAWKWLKQNYTLEVNPGFEASSDPTAPYQGLFYYFHTMARALDLFGEETVQDAEGNPHAWRAELVGRLVAMQRKDGSWINENAERWFEGNPVLATAYAMMAIDEALPRADAGAAPAGEDAEKGEGK